MLTEKIMSKLSPKKQEKFSRGLRIFNIIKNTICWVSIAVLVFTVLSFLIVRINGGTPSIFGYTIHRVQSGSMEPALMVGDIILNKDVDDVTTLKLGDIITFQGGDQYGNNHITHRIVQEPRMGKDGVYYLITKGDANDVEDDEIDETMVESVFVQKVEFLERFYTFFLSPWGLIIFIVLLVIIFFDEAVSVVRIISGNYPDEEEEDISDIIERIKREDTQNKAFAQEKSEEPDDSNKVNEKKNDKSLRDNDEEEENISE